MNLYQLLAETREVCGKHDENLKVCTSIICYKTVTRRQNPVKPGKVSWPMWHENPLYIWRPVYQHCATANTSLKSGQIKLRGFMVYVGGHVTHLIHISLNSVFIWLDLTITHIPQHQLNRKRLQDICGHGFWIIIEQSIPWGSNESRYKDSPSTMY